MKRHLGPMLTAVALLCAPLAWSQSGYSTYPTSSDQQQADSTGSSQSGYSTYPASNSPSDSQQPPAGSMGSPQSGYSTYPTYNSSSDSQQQQSGPAGSPQPVYSTYGAFGDPQQQQQSGASDSSQNGGGAGDVQSGSDDSQSGLGGPQETFTHPEKLPPLNLFSDAISHTGYTFNFSGGTVAQHINSYLGTPGYWDSLWLATGGLTLVQVRSNLLWSLGYTGGVNQTVGTTYATYSNLNQNANGHIIWRLAKRWQFRLKDTYFYSDDPFQPFFTFLGEPTANNPNPVIYFPQSVVEQNQATADLSYSLGAHDTINFYGGESFQHFLRGFQTQSSLNLGSLWNSTTYAGGVFYQHQFSARLSAGGGYIFSALDFGHGQSRAGVQEFQTFVSYRVSRTLSISGWVGPELTHTKDLVPLVCFPSGCLIEEQHSSYLNVAEGGTLTWAASPKNVFAVQANNSITNGGGLFGAVKYYSFTGTYSRPINRNWSFAAGALLSHSDSLTNFSGDQFIHSAQGTLTFARRINDAWNMNAYYVLIRQKQNFYGPFGVPTTTGTSGLGLTVQYTLNHSLGR